MNSQCAHRSKTSVWNFEDRRYWELLPPHVAPQVLREENGMEPRCLRHYDE